MCASLPPPLWTIPRARCFATRSRADTAAALCQSLLFHELSCLRTRALLAPSIVLDPATVILQLARPVAYISDVLHASWYWH